MRFPICRAALALVLAALAAAASAVPAAAQQGGAAQQLRTACEADAKKHCNGIQPGGGRLLQCLRGKQSELSPTCQTALKSMPAR